LPGFHTRGLTGFPISTRMTIPNGGTPLRAVAELRVSSRGRMRFCSPRWRAPRLVWTVGGGETYGMPVAWVNTAGAAAPSGPGDAHASLRKALGYTGSLIVEAACAWTRGVPRRGGSRRTDRRPIEPCADPRGPDNPRAGRERNQGAALRAAGAVDVVPLVSPGVTARLLIVGLAIAAPWLPSEILRHVCYASRNVWDADEGWPDKGYPHD
jgi:hypothetical protein